MLPGETRDDFPPVWGPDSKKSRDPGGLQSGEQAVERTDSDASREDVVCQNALGEAEVIAEHTLEHCPQIQRGGKVATLIELLVAKSGPVRQHAPAAHRSTEEK